LYQNQHWGVTKLGRGDGKKVGGLGGVKVWEENGRESQMGWGRV